MAELLDRQGVTAGLGRGAALAASRRARCRREVSGRDYLRSLLVLEGQLPQEQISRALGVSQPAIAKALRRARQLPQVPEGFSGATPYEIAQRYAAGDLDRATAVDELGRWAYVPGPASWDQAWADQEVVPEGTIEDVGRAYDDGLLDADMHDEVLRRAAAQQEAS